MGVLGQPGHNLDVANLAATLDIDPLPAGKTIAAHRQAHQAPGATLVGTAAKPGPDTRMLRRIAQPIGGVASVGEFTRMAEDNPQASSLPGDRDRNSNGNPRNALASTATGEADDVPEASHRTDETGLPPLPKDTLIAAPHQSAGCVHGARRIFPAMREIADGTARARSSKAPQAEGSLRA